MVHVVLIFFLGSWECFHSSVLNQLFHQAETVLDEGKTDGLSTKLRLAPPEVFEEFGIVVSPRRENRDLQAVALAACVSCSPGSTDGIM